MLIGATAPAATTTPASGLSTVLGGLSPLTMIGLAVAAWMLLKK